MKLNSVSSRILVAAILACDLCAPLLSGAGKPLPLAVGDEEFFIISSVDCNKQQIVLKRPTEVTQLIGVNDKTVYRDEQGKTIEFKNLRAGDTLYVRFSKKPDGTAFASSIRKGPMTVEELHRRYVPFQ